VDPAVRFPGIFAFCAEVGIDMRREPIPIAPAAHYFMGGVHTDTRGRTTIDGLYACGEAACTGVHGANRLASNSLLETVVFGKRVAEHILSGEGGRAAPSGDVEDIAVPASGIDRVGLQHLMWAAAGIERSGDGIREGISVLESNGPNPEGAQSEEERMSMIAALMLRAALARTESRGAHYRADYPERDDAHWQRRQVYRRAD
jgi:L-aspartate oxidase